jgi:hypothetical protein
MKYTHRTITVYRKLRYICVCVYVCMCVCVCVWGGVIVSTFGGEAVSRATTRHVISVPLTSTAVLTRRKRCLLAPPVPIQTSQKGMLKSHIRTHRGVPPGQSAWAFFPSISAPPNISGHGYLHCDTKAHTKSYLQNHFKTHALAWLFSWHHTGAIDLTKHIWACTEQYSLRALAAPTTHPPKIPYPRTSEHSHERRCLSSRTAIFGQP